MREKITELSSRHPKASWMAPWRTGISALRYTFTSTIVDTVGNYAIPSPSPATTILFSYPTSVLIIPLYFRTGTPPLHDPMHRPSYSNPPTAHSPPLHHPVPQHVSTVPMMRSPPPPTTAQQAPQPSSNYGNPYQTHHSASASGSGTQVYPTYGGFLNDPTAQMGFQVTKTAAIAGQEYLENNVR